MKYEGTCSQTDPELWFPPQPNSNTGEARVAKLMCLSCGVYEDCLNDVLAGNVEAEYGIFAGLGPKERRKLNG